LFKAVRNKISSSSRFRALPARVPATQFITIRVGGVPSDRSAPGAVQLDRAGNHDDAR